MKLRKDIVVENAEDELVILDKANGKVHQLNQAAALVWNGLSEGLGADDIARRLSHTFEVDNDRAASDVLRTIEQLSGLGLLEDD